MKIDFIKLENYRQYKDEKIEFPLLENQNLMVIQGVNGAGKTNLLNAITWCLYGKEKHLEGKYEGFPLVNKITLNELEPGKKCNVGVLIQMKDEEGKKIIIGRSLKFQKLKDGEMITVRDPLSSSSDGATFMMIQQIKKDMVDVKDPEYVLNRLIPESIEEYFFFDGEKLNDYFRATSGEKIHEAVFKISQLGLLENAIEHLENKKKDFVGRAGKLGSKAEEIREALNESEKLQKEYKKELNSLKERKGEAQKKEDEYSEKLRTSSILNVRELEKERIEIEEELGKLEERIEELEKEKFDYLIKIAPSIFAYDPITKTKEMIGRGKEAGDIPPDYKKNFLEKLIREGECICGTDISKENECRKNIEKLLRECDDISNISGELTEGYANLRFIIDDLKDFRKKQISYGKRIKELEEDRKRKSERLKKISEKIRGIDFEQIKRWEYKLTEYKEIKNNLVEQIAERKYYIAQEEKKIDKLNRLFDEELRKEERHKKLRKVLAFCDKSLYALKKIKNEIMEDVRKEIEEKTKSQFLDLIWKKETYKDVRIDEKYHISVLDQYGMEGIGTLSAGERQALALSFIAALNSVSGFNVPIIIDTPLGRMSKEPKKNIASNLPNYFKGKQLTLLVTEEEYTLEVRDKLSKRVGKEYVINFRETKKGSEAKVVAYG
jgi:DNA sulfur modification protein DndD